jgi:hypothetical protein
MLVHSFGKKNEGFEDYEKFTDSFKVKAESNRIHHAANLDRVDLYLGWVEGNPKYLSTGEIGKPVKGKVAARKCQNKGVRSSFFTDLDVEK